MNKLISIITFLISSVCLADVSVGGIYGNFKGVLIGDHNLFDQEFDRFETKRYGSAVSRLEIGNGIGVHLISNNGIIVNDKEINSFVYPRLGLEVFNGSIILNTNDNVEDYYQWLPTISLGPQFKIFGYKVLVNFKAGGSVSNLGIESKLPKFHNSFGMGIYLNKYLTLSHNVIGDNFIRSVELQNRNILFRVEDKRGSLRETSGLLMLIIKRGIK